MRQVEEAVLHAADAASGSGVETAVASGNMKDTLGRQRRAFLEEGPPSPGLRIDRIQRAISLLADNRKRICEALAEDFVWRSHDLTLLTDIYATIEGLRHNKKNLRRWMKSERRRVQFPLNLLGAKAHVQYQPLGTVGIIAPWNFPVNLTFAPLSGVLAAGNRAMIKLSEFTPATGDLIAGLVRASFDEAEVAAFTGGPEVGSTFAALPFDHLVFTGSPRVGRLVMRAAAANLTPVTLELGGKSPVVIGKTADIRLAAKRIAWGKTLNSGQVCIAPDYVLLPAGRVEEFVQAFKDAVAAMFPTLRDNQDYTSIVNRQQYERLQAYLQDAKVRGVEVVEINPVQEDFVGHKARKVPPTLLIEPSEDCLVMQNEIFGPLLPVLSYKTMDDVIAYINARPRPLALYYFGGDGTEEERLLSRTCSGGACVNEVLAHALQDDLPFGGCGNSGMGAYHGEVGFKTFSHAKSVFRAGRFDALAVMRPPYGEWLRKLLILAIGR